MGSVDLACRVLETAYLEDPTARGRSCMHGVGERLESDGSLSPVTLICMCEAFVCSQRENIRIRPFRGDLQAPAACAGHVESTAPPQGEGPRPTHEVALVRPQAAGPAKDRRDGRTYCKDHVTRAFYPSLR